MSHREPVATLVERDERGIVLRLIPERGPAVRFSVRASVDGRPVYAANQLPAAHAMAAVYQAMGAALRELATIASSRFASSLAETIREDWARRR